MTMSKHFLPRNRVASKLLACAALMTSAVAVAAPTAPAPGAAAKPLGFAVSPPWAGGQTHRIMQGYGAGMHRNTNVADRTNDHHALDFDLTLGESVHPIAPGTVRYAGEARGGWSAYGKIVFVDHGNGYQSMYAHMDTTEVQPGQAVSAGTRLGGAGSSGTIAVHLHLALYRGAQFLNDASGAGPYGGVAVVPEVFASCTKNGGACEQLVSGSAMTNTLPPPVTIPPVDPPATCPYGSVQSRVHRNATKPWATAISVPAGKPFEVGAFRDGSGQLADSGTTISVTGPGGFSASPANLGKVTPPAPGTYSVRVACGNLSETATVTVTEGTVCPYTSVQARVHRDVTKPWTQSMGLRLGKSFEVAAFRDGAGQLADTGTKIQVTGPNGFTAAPTNLAKVTPPAIGTYNVRVTCGALSETATVNVKPQ
jgi:murein DD-endopeptidase MepM/ murein hydrolase activator NlpD